MEQVDLADIQNLQPTILRRKDEHLELVLEGAGVTKTSTGLEQVVFEHCALPEIALDDIDLSTEFLDWRLKAPLLISSMTGGPRRATAINHHLAEAACELGIPFAVGSQRIALERAGNAGIGSALRSIMGDLPLLSNIGAAQLAERGGLAKAQEAVAMIEADALIIHLNPLQEALQTGGDRNWTGLLEHIARLVDCVGVPVVVKEVGCGISATTALQLREAGVAAIDIAGAGGTSWAAIEAGRARHAAQRDVATAFAQWGIPTARSLVEVGQHCRGMPLIASGGIRDGLDAARAIRLGANLVGQAANVLEAALDSTEAVIDQFNTTLDQLRVACFCTGSRNLSALAQAPIQLPITWMP